MPLTPDQCEEALDLIAHQALSLRELAVHFGYTRNGHMEISKSLNVAQYAERLQSARASSAEVCLERGREQLLDALPKDSNLDGGVARALAQEWARLAAVRNPRYRDGSKVELTGANGGPIKIDRALTDDELMAIAAKANTTGSV